LSYLGRTKVDESSKISFVLYDNKYLPICLTDGFIDSANKQNLDNLAQVICRETTKNYEINTVLGYLEGADCPSE